MPVRIVSSDERMAVRFLNMSVRELVRFDFHSKILNFILSSDQNRLTVLLSEIKEAIRVVRLQEMLNPLFVPAAIRRPIWPFLAKVLPLMSRKNINRINSFQPRPSEKDHPETTTPLLTLETGSRKNELLTRSLKDLFCPRNSPSPLHPQGLYHELGKSARLPTQR